MSNNFRFCANCGAQLSETAITCYQCKSLVSSPKRPKKTAKLLKIPALSAEKAILICVFLLGAFFLVTGLSALNSLTSRTGEPPSTGFIAFFISFGVVLLFFGTLYVLKPKTRGALSGGLAVMTLLFVVISIVAYIFTMIAGVSLLAVALVIIVGIFTLLSYLVKKLVKK